MRLTHRCSLAIIGILLFTAGLFLSGCQLLQKEPTSPADSLAVADSIQFAPDSLLAQQVADDSTSSSAQDSVRSAGADSLSSTALLTATIQNADSQLVAIPVVQLDSLLKRLDALQLQEAASDTTGGRNAALQDQLTNAVGGIQHLGRNILVSIITILVFFYIIRSIAWTLERFSEQSATRRLFFKRLVPIIRLLAWSLAIYIILIHIFALKESQLISAWAAVGLAVGFASQDILKNIFGGIIIIIDQPFQVGDKINIGGTYGEVTSIGLRSTRIVTPDDNLVSVPNAQVVESQVANANAGALDCQVVIDLYLPGWVDVMEAKAIAYDAAANSNYVYLQKPIVVNIKDLFKETFLTHLAVKAYVIDTRYEFAFASDVTETAKAQFQRKGMLAPLGKILAVDQGTAEHKAAENKAAENKAAENGAVDNSSVENRATAQGSADSHQEK
ncbi:MAG: mechanosensitive ion channel family protein [Rhodothermales bacterium]